MDLKLKNVRLAFPALWTAKTVGDEDKPSFSAALILPRNHPQVAEIEKVMLAAATEKWAAKGAETLKQLKAADKVLLHNGDAKDYDGFAGNLFISARNPVRPTVLDANKPPLTEADGRPYAGCYVNVALDVWAQENKYGKRINCTLKGVQFYRDGDAFTGGGVASADDFDDVSVAADAADLI